MKELYARQSIEIAAPASAVWRTLTDPALTKRYMHGCEALSDWTPGSRLDWRGVFDGKELVPVTGKVLVCEPERRLDYTTFDLLAGRADVPEHHLTVTSRITPRPGGVLLEVTQGDFANASQPHTEEELNAGWRQVLEQIKALAESL